MLLIFLLIVMSINYGFIQIVIYIKKTHYGSSNFVKNVQNAIGIFKKMKDATI